MTRPLTLALGLAVAALGLAAPSAAQDAMYEPCRSDDLVCRIDRLERTVAQLAALLEEREDDRPRRRDRGVEMPAAEYCSSSSCVEEAVRLCNVAGFARGVPAQTSPAFMGSRLDRVTCLD